MSRVHSERSRPRRPASFRGGTISLAVVLLMLGATAYPASSQEAGEVEEILSFDVQMDVGPGGAMFVVETIEVRALGREIRRGIYRDFPTRFPAQGGSGRVVAPFEVRAVSRDGAPEPYAIEQIMGLENRGGVRVRIGAPDVILAPGVHRYEIVYETERWMRFEEEADVFYWNVTGNGWDFPIESATVSVMFPEAPPPASTTIQAWTGPDGSTDQDATWGVGVAGDVRAQTTAALGAREGLTVRIDLPKGIVPPPTPEQQSEWTRLDWGGYFQAIPVVLLVLGIYLAMWIKVGRDPAEGPVMTEYRPPDGFSPAAVGFIRRRGYGTEQLTAALVDLAVAGAVRIERDGGKWRIESTGVQPEGLEADEQRLLTHLRAKGTLTLSGSSSPSLRKALKDFRKGLSRELEGRYFVNNRGWFAWGVGVSLVGMAVLAWWARFSVSPEIWFLVLWLSFWSIGVATLLYRAGKSWGQAFSGDPLGLLGAFFVTLFAVPFVGAEIFVGWMLLQGAPTHLTAAAVAIGVTNVAFYHLLERPTLAGRGVLDKIEGFRSYLAAAEGDVFDRLQRPEQGLELFEAYLPYAIALGVENEWADRFESILRPSTAAEASRVPTSPSWYVGDTSGGLSGLTSSLGSSLSSSLSASSAPPSSSGSGGGGGGSSGGGGGGGGGGGW